MGHIKITKGVDIPIAGGPSGAPQPLVIDTRAAQPAQPWLVALDLTTLNQVAFKLLVGVDERVKLGQPLVEDKASPGRFLVAPAGGVVREIRRGWKRRLLYIVIEIDQEEAAEQHPLSSLKGAGRDQLISYLNRAGLFSFIRQRPFNLWADPKKTPRSIFVKALESAPFAPPAELQVAGYETEFQIGLEVLTKLTSGEVHLVYRQGTACHAFSEAVGVCKHSAEGPHPVSNPSVHIERIDPIKSVEDVVWTVTAHTVVAIGHLIATGRYFVPRIVSVAGAGVVAGGAGFFRVREGVSIAALLAHRKKTGAIRLISGNPLTGHAVTAEDFLGREDTVFCLIPENEHREFLSFFRLGTEKYTFSRAYASGFRRGADHQYAFTTNQHGEERPFIESSLYDGVMPLNVPTVALVRAILAEDYDLAVRLGLLEVDAEDFALPAFVCPSKIEMVDIVKSSLARYAKETLK